MSSLSVALNNSLSGLRASQSAFGVLSHNIANANNPNHTRQIISQSSVYVGDVGSGVRVEDVIRRVDTFLQRSILTQNSVVENVGVVDDFYDRIQILLGNPSGENSLDETLTTFYNSLSALSETPERSSFRSNAINSAVELSRQISDLAFRLEDLRFQADRELSGSVNTVNSVLARLEQLNVAINTASSLNRSTAGLEDERDNLLEELSGQLEISTFFDAGGSVNISTAGGVSLLDSAGRRELVYRGASSAEAFALDTALTPLQVRNRNSNFPGDTELVSAGTRGNVTSILSGGKIFGLHEVRDNVIPDILSQLDNLASVLRDTVNAVHNQGTAFPPPASLTGTRAVRAGQFFGWEGGVRIAVLQANGEPIPSGYADEPNGFQPLALDLASLDSGKGVGSPSVQTILDEINNHFRIPPAKAKVGILNNVQIVADQDRLPGSPVPEFTFDFDLQNLSGESGEFFFTGVEVLDDTGADITNVTQDVPRLVVDPVNSYTTALGSTDVVITTAGVHNVSVGDRIFLSEPPGGPFNGIPAAQLGGYFEVTAITGNTVTIEVGTPATAAGPVAAAGVTLSTPFAEIAETGKTRTVSNGAVTVNLGANIVSAFYDISVNVAVQQEDGTLTTSRITYRVPNNVNNVRGQRYDNVAVTGGGQRVLPQGLRQGLRAVLVDENGVELREVSGALNPEVPAFVKLIGVGLDGDARVAIDDLGSRQLGEPGAVPTDPGTGRSFAHFFELNNLFVNNGSVNTGDRFNGSALNLAVDERFERDPNLIALGRLEQSRQSTTAGAAPNLTFTLFGGDNRNVQALRATGLSTQAFSAAGGLPDTRLTLGGYTGEFLGFLASKSAEAQTIASTEEALLGGFEERQQALGSVNLDEELANTLIYQNAYTAAARVISLVDELFSDLLQVI